MLGIGKKDKDKQDGSKKKGAWGTKVAGGVYSAYAQTKVGTKNTQQAVKIQLTDQKITARKQKFGVEYLDLVEQNAAEEQLEACLIAAVEEIARLRGKVSKYEGHIAQNKQKMETKIAKHKGEIPHTQPSIEVNDSKDPSESTSSAGAGNQIATTTTSTSAVPAAPAAAASVAAASVTDNINPFNDGEEEDEKIPSVTAATSTPASASASNINPFEDADEKTPSASIRADSTAPIAEAVPVSDANNPFDDDDGAPSASASNVNPFDDDDDADAAAASNSNPFDDDDDDDETPPSKSNAVNPFDV